MQQRFFSMRRGGALRLGMMQIDRLIQPPDIRPVAFPAAVPGSVRTQDDIFWHRMLSLSGLGMAAAY